MLTLAAYERYQPPMLSRRATNNQLWMRHRALRTYPQGPPRSRRACAKPDLDLFLVWSERQCRTGLVMRHPTRVLGTCPPLSQRMPRHAPMKGLGTCPLPNRYVPRRLGSTHRLPKLGVGPPRHTDKGKMILPELGAGPQRHTDKATMLLLKLGAGPPGHTERGKMISLKLGTGPPGHTDKAATLLLRMGAGLPGHTDKGRMILLNLGAGLPRHTDKGKTIRLSPYSPHACPTTGLGTCPPLSWCMLRLVAGWPPFGAPRPLPFRAGTPLRGQQPIRLLPCCGPSRHISQGERVPHQRRKG